MKKLMITITASLIILSSCQEREIQDVEDSVFSTGLPSTLSNLRSDQSAKPTANIVAAIPATWNGKYSAYFSYGDIAGQNAGWALEITITNNKITAKGEGFQMAFLDELSAKAIGSKLVLTHLRNISGYATGKKMNPEFTLFNDRGKFYLKSDWIDGDVKNKPSTLGYQIDRTGL